MYTNVQYMKEMENIFQVPTNFLLQLLFLSATVFDKNKKNIVSTIKNFI